MEYSHLQYSRYLYLNVFCSEFEKKKKLKETQLKTILFFLLQNRLSFCSLQSLNRLKTRRSLFEPPKTFFRLITIFEFKLNSSVLKSADSYAHNHLKTTGGRDTIGTGISFHFESFCLYVALIKPRLFVLSALYKCTAPLVRGRMIPLGNVAFRKLVKYGNLREKHLESLVVYITTVLVRVTFRAPSELRAKLFPFECLNTFVPSPFRQTEVIRYFRVYRCILICINAYYTDNRREQLERKIFCVMRNLSFSKFCVFNTNYCYRITINYYHHRVNCIRFNILSSASVFSPFTYCFQLLAAKFSVREV